MSDPNQQFAAALAAHRLGQFDQAEKTYRAVLAADPRHAPALTNLAVLAIQRAQHAEALELLDRSLAVAPDQPQALAHRGAILCQFGRYPEALANLDRAVALRPNDVPTHHNRAAALFELQRYEEALEGFERALALNAEFAEAHLNRGNTLIQLDRVSEALASFDRAIVLRPDLADAHANRGNALEGFGLDLEALASFDRAIALRPEFAEAHSNRGNALTNLGQYEEALASFDRAIALRPALAEAHNGRGASLFALGRDAEALASFDQALEFRPDYPEALSNRGNVLMALERPADAIAAYTRAADLDPRRAETFRRRALALANIQDRAGANADFNRALALDPDLGMLRGFRVHVRKHLCDWEGIDSEIRSLLAAVDRGELATDPFSLLGAGSTPAQQRRAAEIWSDWRFSASRGRERSIPAPRHDRIRIGYFSRDLRNHAQGFLMPGLIENHDRSEFEIYGYYYGPRTDDAVHRRLAQAFDQFRVIGAESDEAVAALARADELDIAVDLMGHTAHSRTGIFGYRAAPVQINYLGYPGTSGARFMDYLIADPVVLPLAQFPNFSEKIVWLPYTYQATDALRLIAETSYTRKQLGLPERGFVFCCFNANWKITPEVFDVWMNLLRVVEGSVLWLLQSNATAPGNLRNEAARRGVAPERLVFAGVVAAPEHLARQRVADLFIDTFQVGAHTTASDALWAGLPLLTCPGETFASRVAASLLAAIGLPELIAPSAAAYEAIALELAADPARLAALRERLGRNRATRPLFDTVLFTRAIEAAYRFIAERSRNGLAPEHLRVPELETR